MNIFVCVVPLLCLVLYGCGGGSGSGDDSGDAITDPTSPAPNMAPAADAGDDKTVIVNHSITITGTASDTDGSIASYEWKKGDTTLATSASFSYTPTAVGTDTLSLIVTDDDGANASDTIGVEVTPMWVEVAAITNVCDHVVCATASVSLSTDTFSLENLIGDPDLRSVDNAEINGFAANMNLTFFDYPLVGNYPIADRKSFFETGRGSNGVYVATDRWHDPISNESAFHLRNPLIPDYYSTTWTQKGVDASFVNAGQIGTPKISRYPNHGQQMYDQSNGVYGYDVIRSTAGTNDVLSGLLQDQIDFALSVNGVRPAYASYKNGQSGSHYGLSKFFLAARNSQVSGVTSYGSSVIDFSTLGLAGNTAGSTNQAEMINHSTTTIQGGFVGTRSESHTDAFSHMASAISSRGWYTDFTHFHTAPDTELEAFFTGLDNQIGTADVARVGYGEAARQLFARKLINKLPVYDTGSTLIIMHDILSDATVLDPTAEVALEGTVWVQIDTTGTLLAGSDIKEINGYRVRSFGSNIFAIGMFFTDGQFLPAELQATEIPTYYSTARPVINTPIENGETLSFTTDIPTKSVMWTTKRGSAKYTATIRARSNALSTSHVFDLSELPSGMLDVYFGAISADGHSSLSDPHWYR